MQSESLTRHKDVINWVNEVALLTKPDKILWIDGSEAEREELEKEAFQSGELIQLNQEKLPGCVYHRTALNDVARTENLTFICTSKKEDAGPTNNWMSPADAYARLSDIFRDSMRGRTMYVIPFIMGIPGSPFNKIGVEITDSIYVVLNMRIMTRMGDIAWKELGDNGTFTRCLHGKADLDINRRYICHFPEDNTIWSVGSGYGGNVLLGKKSLSLRIASYLARNEGWMAEHMMIVGVQNQGAKSPILPAHSRAHAVKPISQCSSRRTVCPATRFLPSLMTSHGCALAPTDASTPSIQNTFFGVAPGTNYRTNQTQWKQ